MLVALVLSLAALMWSGVSNLVLGDDGYLLRNLLLTALLLLGAYRAGWGADDLGLSPAHLRRGVTVGLVAVAVIAAGLVGGVLLADRVPLVSSLLADERAVAASDRLLYEALLRIPLGTAVFEEILFRGVLFGAFLRAAPGSGKALPDSMDRPLRRRDAAQPQPGPVLPQRVHASSPRAGERRAIVATSVVFGLWHVAPTAVALEVNAVAATSATGVLAIGAAVVVTTIAGLLFAWLRRVSGSLVAPVLAHIATNVGGLLAATAAGP